PRPASYLEIHLLGHERVDAAFHLVKTGPTTGTFILAAIRGTSARLAANRAITPVMQGIIGNVMLAQVFPDRVTCPIRHRIQLHDVLPGSFVERIKLNDADGGTGIGLLAPEPS